MNRTLSKHAAALWALWSLGALPACGLNPPPTTDYSQSDLYFGFTLVDPAEERIQPNTYNVNARAASDTALALFRQATEADPSYALAHAHLAFAYAWTAVFIEEAPHLIDEAKRELAAAEAIEDLALIHLVRGFLLFSRYEGWRIAGALRELKLAESLDPLLSDLEFAELYFHIGLFDQWRRISAIVLDNDRTSLQIKNSIVNTFFLGNMPEEGLAAQKRLLNEGPDWRYFMLTRQVDKAAPLVEQQAREQPENLWSQIQLARLRAMQGHHREAQAMLPRTGLGHPSADGARLAPDDEDLQPRSTCRPGCCSSGAGTDIRFRTTNPIQRGAVCAHGSGYVTGHVTID